VHDVGLSVGVRLSVVAVLVDQFQLRGLIPAAGCIGAAKEIPEAQVVQPLSPAVVDDV
jgi:hypothetical protein